MVNKEEETLEESAWRKQLHEAMLQLPGTFVRSDERGGVGEVVGDKEIAAIE